MKQIWDIEELAEHWSLKFEETHGYSSHSDHRFWFYPIT